MSDDTAAITAAYEAELVTIRAQLAAERTQRISTEARAFADSAIHASKAFPGERDSLVALYQTLAHDDAQSPRDGTSRVELLNAAMAARPGHMLIEERVALDTATLVLNTTETPQATDDEVAKTADFARKYAERANGKGR